MEVNHRQPDYAGLQPAHSPPYGQPHDFSQVASRSQFQPQEYQEKRICGLKRTIFWVTFAVISVLLLAAVLGGVLGGVLSRNSNSRDSSSTTVSVTVSMPFPTADDAGTMDITSTQGSRTTESIRATGTTAEPSPSSTVIRGRCPSGNGDRWTSSSGFNTFQIYCSTDFPLNDMIPGYHMPVVNFDGCLELCAMMNDARNFTLCYGVSHAYVLWGGRNTTMCYLKNPEIDAERYGTSLTTVDSALLVL